MNDEAGKNLSYYADYITSMIMFCILIAITVTSYKYVIQIDRHNVIMNASYKVTESIIQDLESIDKNKIPEGDSLSDIFTKKYSLNKYGRKLKDLKIQVKVNEPDSNHSSLKKILIKLNFQKTGKTYTTEPVIVFLFKPGLT